MVIQPQTSAPHWNCSRTGLGHKSILLNDRYGFMKRNAGNGIQIEKARGREGSSRVHLPRHSSQGGMDDRLLTTTTADRVSKVFPKREGGKSVAQATIRQLDGPFSLLARMIFWNLQRGESCSCNTKSAMADSMLLALEVNDLTLFQGTRRQVPLDQRLLAGLSNQVGGCLFHEIMTR